MALRVWAQAAPRPLVIVLDEIDALRDEVLISVLRQLRAGYDKRPQDFPWSLALCGLRDVRDYKVAEGRLGTASPFNIKVESLTMRNFNEEEVAELYAQHTQETGQVFLAETLAAAFRDTQGQPWLVNALARQLVQVVASNGRAVTAADEDAARQILIRRMDTHLDCWADELREPRVKRIVEPMLLGEAPYAQRTGPQPGREPGDAAVGMRDARAKPAISLAFSAPAKIILPRRCGIT